MGATVARKLSGKPDKIFESNQQWTDIWVVILFSCYWNLYKTSLYWLLCLWEALPFFTLPNTHYNIVHVLAIYKFYWAAMNKIFIYTCLCVNKMTWEFFTWLQSFHHVKLQCSFPSLWNMEETSKELPNFSVGIDLWGPDPTSNKNRAEKNLQVACFANLSEDQLQKILLLRTDPRCCSVIK